MWNQEMWNYKVGRQFIAQLHRAGPYAAAVILIAREPIERDKTLLEDSPSRGRTRHGNRQIGPWCRPPADPAGGPAAASGAESAGFRRARRKV